jgi:menaquinone-dependent protoporphyrinogen oxidase
MANILVTYASMAGSTAEVASAIARSLEEQGCRVVVAPLTGEPSLEGMDAVVVGGPMIMGWHRQSLRFLRRQRRSWGDKPVAVFVTAMKLTRANAQAPLDFPLVLDPGIMVQEAAPGRLSIRERYSLPTNYLRPVLRAIKPNMPASAAIFGGRLLFGRLPWWAVPVALLAAGAQAGDKRDWELIRSWAAGLPASMGLEPAERAASS